ncbi:hypothetical protein NE236_27485 [Actinoallomurus purpureus]|uniref:hypothetical protein n=1 Tax=Actinoallomurus purpureus TaxID=478114 RepID=UPI002092DC78|nr:hypothetical protein [Actinoallomurus purpureus]MCO6008723.1 hypothetical protein [Actinoallomurus purpureus]
MAVDERAREDILALGDTILETREAVTRIERRQNQHGRVLSELQHGVAENTRRLDNLETRFEGFETRFEGLETRFEGFEKSVGGLEKSVGGLETQMEGVRGAVDEILSLLKQKG